MRIFTIFGNKAYLRSHGVTTTDLGRASWQKSSFSSMNGTCVEISRLSADRIGVRDTKDRGAGPILVFTRAEWTAFVAGAKDGQFDNFWNCP
jgi:hypothetical protein